MKDKRKSNKEEIKKDRIRKGKEIRESGRGKHPL
jgi:hypothetical protein